MTSPRRRSSRPDAGCGVFGAVTSGAGCTGSRQTARGIFIAKRGAGRGWKSPRRRSCAAAMSCSGDAAAVADARWRGCRWSIARRWCCRFRRAESCRSRAGARVRGNDGFVADLPRETPTETPFPPGNDERRRTPAKTPRARRARAGRHGARTGAASRAHRLFTIRAGACAGTPAGPLALGACGSGRTGARAGGGTFWRPQEPPGRSAQSGPGEAAVLAQVEASFRRTRCGYRRRGGRDEGRLAAGKQSPSDQPLLVEFRRGDSLVRVLSYSGRHVCVDLDGRHACFDALLADHGEVIVAGEDFVWTAENRATAGGWKITAAPLGDAS